MKFCSTKATPPWGSQNRVKRICNCASCWGVSRHRSRARTYRTARMTRAITATGVYFLMSACGREGRPQLFATLAPPGIVKDGMVPGWGRGESGTEGGRRPPWRGGARARGPGVGGGEVRSPHLPAELPRSLGILLGLFCQSGGHFRNVCGPHPPAPPCQSTLWRMRFLTAPSCLPSPSPTGRGRGRTHSLVSPPGPKPPGCCES